MTAAAPEWTEWWEAAERRVLLVQTCEGCGHVQHYPRAVCLRCGTDRLGWMEASGDATVYSFTLSHRSPDPERLPPPYLLALVDLAEGPRMLTRLVTDLPDSVHCDQAVSVTWITLDDGRHLPVFEPVDKETDK